MTERRIEVDGDFSLAATCGPVAWGKGRWPNVDWIDGGLIWVGREGDAVAWRRVRQPAPGSLLIEGDAEPAGDTAWARAVLAIERSPPAVTDPIIAAIAAKYPGLRPFNAASLFDGIVSCIAGQSITVAAAAVTEARICALFHPGVELRGRRFWPMPLPDQIARSEPALVRMAGVTWKRAEAIVAAAIAWRNGEIPETTDALREPDGARVALRALPLVGEWTAESALLWGIGLGDAFPPNDAALLRAARLAYDRPEMTHKDLVRRSDDWRPARAWASRWLWTALLGPAPG